MGDRRKRFFMREDTEKFNLEQDLQELKADIDKLSVDVAHIMWKATVGQVGNQISRKPFSSVLFAFGAGMVSCLLVKLFRSK